MSLKTITLSERSQKRIHTISSRKYKPLYSGSKTNQWLSRVKEGRGVGMEGLQKACRKYLGVTG